MVMIQKAVVVSLSFFSTVRLSQNQRSASSTQFLRSPFITGAHIILFIMVVVLLSASTTKAFTIGRNCGRFHGWMGVTNPVRSSHSAGVRYYTSSSALRSSSSSDEGILNDPHDVTYQQTLPTISWYPGHIAKAEKELAEYLKKVDVVIEVRDARIPFATTHPLVPSWIGHGKPHIVAMVRIDQISSHALRDWKAYYNRIVSQSQKESMKTSDSSKKHPHVYFVDSKHGQGIIQLKNKVLEAGEAVNAKRIKRGIEPRAVRAAIIGFPNVGKSALINRLLGRKMAKSRNLPGVTRSMNWVRLGRGDSEGPMDNHLELLDSPGIIPAKQLDPVNAVKLAICNDIGEASYDRVVVAGVMCDCLNILHRNHPKYVDMSTIQKRFGALDGEPFSALTGEDIVYRFADKQYQGNLISAADKLLGDFRKGFLGFGSLEAPPKSHFEFEKHLKAKKLEKATTPGSVESMSHGEQDRKKVEYNQETSVSRVEEKKRIEEAINVLDIGKGNYEGW